MEALDLDTASEEEIEEAAREKGWVPEQDWRGKPEQWTDAKSFLGTSMRDLRDENGDLRSQIEALQDTVIRIEATTAAQVTQAEKNAYEQARADLVDQQRQAVADGDLDSFNSTTQKIQETDEEFSKKSQQSGPDPVALQFKRDNPEYFSDPDNYDLMERRTRWLMNQKQYSSSGEFFNDLKKSMDSALEKQNKEPAPRIPSLDSGGAKVTKTKARTFNSMPDGAKAGYQRSLQYSGREDSKEAQEAFAKTYWDQIEDE